MTEFDRIQKCFGALDERTRGFLEDGYIIKFTYKWRTSACVKLIHHNGNTIFLKVDSVDGILTQSTNGEQTHSEKVC